jgi:hydroxymethylpyrimidine/phosphomethylpyrimidine kinase
MVRVALSVAGSDPSGGAGIQADLKTFQRHGVYGCAVPTLLTVQNTRFVARVETLGPELVAAQLAAVLDDIPPHALKTGALGNAGIVHALVETLAGCQAPLVIDPVLLSKSGKALLDAEGLAALRGLLLPRALLITPNRDEAALLTGRSLESEQDWEDAARALCDLGAQAALLKGGHREGRPVDLLLYQGRFLRFDGPRIDTRHTHGVGCSLSAAITSQLALGRPLDDACARAKRWLTRALQSAPGLGAGHGPIDHGADPD